MGKVFLGMISVFVSLALCGCAVLLLGGGVAGGIAISKDTAKLEKDMNFNHAWKTTYKVIDDMGIIESHDKDAGKIEAEVNNSNVTARVTQVTSKSVRIEVKSRKALFPNLDLAMEITNKINNKL